MRARVLAALILVAALADSASATQPLGLGRTPTAAEIAAWDIDVRADGRGLPPGQGSVEQGRALFAARCASCHGAEGKGGAAEALVGGAGTLATAHPVRTVGSYWPYASTLFDYIRRAMPFNAPQSLGADEVYALSAYILNLNGIVPASARLDAKSLAKVRMPNQGGFTSPDPRPDVRAPARAGRGP
jgi:cytochrome c